MIRRILRSRAFAALPAIAVVALLGLATSSAASAAVGLEYVGWQTAYMSGTSSLSTTGDYGTGSLGLGMMPGTNPAITALNSVTTGTQMAFQANTGALWTAGTDGTGNLDLGMMPGTSPSIAPIPGGGYIIAFQANTGVLWTYSSSSGARDLGVPVLNAKSSPDIIWTTGDEFEIAYEDQGNTLAVVSVTANGTGSANPYGLGVGMWPGTTPSITLSSSSTNEGTWIAVDGSNGHLFLIAGTDPVGSYEDTNVAMATGTSPSVAQGPYGGDLEVAIQDTAGDLYAWGLHGPGDTGVSMYPGTSPSLVCLNFDGCPSGGYEIAVDSSTGTLSMYGTAYTGNTGQTMWAGSSPSIAGLLST